ASPSIGERAGTPRASSLPLRREKDFWLAQGVQQGRDVAVRDIPADEGRVRVQGQPGLELLFMGAQPRLVEDAERDAVTPFVALLDRLGLLRDDLTHARRVADDAVVAVIGELVHAVAALG